RGSVAGRGAGRPQCASDECGCRPRRSHPGKPRGWGGPGTRRQALLPQRRRHRTDQRGYASPTLRPYSEDVSEDPGGIRPFTDPDLRLATALQRLARRIDGIEQRLFLVEIGAVDRIAERND